MAGVLLVLALLVQLYVFFYGSPNFWDLPLLGDYQRAFWGDYPPGQLRGGWLHPALMMVSALFQSLRLSLLNSAVGAAWFCIVILFTALTRAGDAVLLGMLFASLAVPAADMVVMNRIKLPSSVPSVIYDEIGRDTSLYIVPLTLCLLCAAVFTPRCASLFRRNHALGCTMTLLIVSRFVVPSPIFSEEGFGGWESVAFVPAAKAWKMLSWRADRSAMMASQAGQPTGFAPIYSISVLTKSR